MPVMRITPAFLFVAACGASADKAATPTTPRLSVDVHAAEESSVNGYVVEDGTGSILIDATRSSADARALLALADAPPTILFITHGHPDHFLGMGALRDAVPGLRIVVASEAIKRDIAGFAAWMDGQGWLEGEPHMKPGAFDYDSIEVLDEPRLVTPGGAVLEVKSDYPAAEAEHTSTVYSKELGALFASDLAYHDVHLWLGVGVTRDAAGQWQELTRTLERTYPADTIVYPGHGAPTGLAVFADVRAYIDDLLAIADGAESDQAAIDAMVAKYPAYANRDFLLMMSVANQRAIRPAAR
jgi:glyoxylase-like metal-dependent hydrolase (beta-lactamase superfamily II)